MLLFVYTLAYSQTYNTTNVFTQAPKIVPLTPEVAGLGKYGDIPVSKYTGIPSIDIPIYTIEVGDLKVPISLNYYASGIQVAQEATWVGLGWNLLCGGCISTIAVGGSDYSGSMGNTASTTVEWDLWQRFLDYQPGYFSDGYPRRFKEEGERLWGGICFAKPEQVVTHTPDPIIARALQGSGERDVYSINFLDKHFKVITHPKDGTVIFLGEKNKCKVVFNSNHTWTITDENGIIYSFIDYEIFSENADIYPTSWYLSTIVTPEGRCIKFNYSLTSNVSTLGTLYEISPFNQQVVPKTREARTISGSRKVLTSIETDREKILFKTSDRTDLDKAVALDSIIVKDVNDNFVSGYKFNYSSFNGQLIGGDYTQDNVPSCDKTTDIAKKSQRLKLLSLSKLNTNKSAPNATYSFEYNGTSLPYKTSFAFDYWGNYNGEENKIPLTGNMVSGLNIYSSIPSMFDQDLLPSCISTGGANRYSSSDYITAGILKSITYPTGGKTSFEFEANEFGNYKFPAASAKSSFLTSYYGSMKKCNFPATDAAYPDLTFTLDKAATVSYEYEVHGKDYPVLSSFNGSGIVIYPVGSSTGPPSILQLNVGDNTSQNSYSANGNYYHVSGSVTLSAGQYKAVMILSTGIINNNMVNSYDTPFNFITGNVSYSYYNTNNLNNIKNGIGGGVRIKTITNSDNNGSTINLEDYKYVKEDGSTSGTLIAPVNNSKTRDVVYVVNNIIEGSIGTTTYSTNITPLSNASKGNIVGYDRVEVSKRSNDTNLKNGKEIFYFENKPAFKFYDDWCSLENSGNGNLLKQVILNSNNDTVKTIGNTYSESEKEIEYLNIHAEDKYYGPTDVCDDSGSWGPHYNKYSYNGRFLLTVYPNINYWTYLSNKTETDYFGTNKVTETTSYKYNSTNYQVSETSELTSDGHQKKTVLKYPNDLITQSPEPYTTMVNDRNMIAPVVEQSSYKDDQFLELVRTNYWYLLNGAIKPYTIESQIGTNPLIKRLTYNVYDVKSNPVHIIQNEAINIVYLWSYNYLYPVAKIEGLTYAQVLNLYPQTSIDNLAKTVNPTSDQINVVRTTLAGQPALVTTYTYKPLVGISSMTDPRGVTTNYTYDTFNRLYFASDADKNILGRYRYAYQNAPDNGMGGYSVPTATVTPGATSYAPGATGTATLGSVTGGTGSYSYSWYLKNSTGTVLASNLNTTSTSFSFTCSQTGILTIQCVIKDNTTGISTTVSTTISSTAVTVNGSFTTMSGYAYPAATISKTGTTVTFVLVFLPTSSPMNVGVNYTVASVSAGFQPSVARTISYVTGGRTWNITFDPSGNVYCRIVSGTNLPVGSAVAFGSLTYNL